MAFSCGACVSKVIGAVFPRRGESSGLFSLRGQVEFVQRIYGKIEKQKSQLPKLSVHRKVELLKNSRLQLTFEGSITKLARLYAENNQVVRTQSGELRPLQAELQRAAGLLQKKGDMEAYFNEQQSFLTNEEKIKNLRVQVQVGFETVENGLGVEKSQFSEELEHLVKLGQVLTRSNEQRREALRFAETVQVPSDEKFQELSEKFGERLDVVAGLGESPHAQDLFERSATISEGVRRLTSAFSLFKQTVMAGGFRRASTYKSHQASLKGMLFDYNNIKDDVKYFVLFRKQFDEDIREINTTLGKIQDALQSEGVWVAELGYQREVLSQMEEDGGLDVGVKHRETTLKTMLANYRSMKNEISQFPALRRQWKVDKEKCKELLSGVKKKIATSEGGCFAGTRLGRFFL